MPDARARLREIARGDALPAYCKGYRGFGELCHSIASLPENVGVFVDAETERGSPLIRIELGHEAANNNIAVLTAGIHAMEWIGVEVAMAAFLRLVERAREVPLPTRIVYYPLLNPDGYRNAEQDLRQGQLRFRRANARGVDLNRNWPTHWSAKFPVTRRIFPEGGRPGAHPASDIEVATVVEHLARLQN